MTLAGALLLSAVLAPTLAAAAGPYGEVTRFGGYDIGAFNNANFDGTPTPGKFVDVQGFAVDPQDTSAAGGTAVYVLDRTSLPGSAAPGGASKWRLQKFAADSTLLGTATFMLPGSSNSAAIGLVVDHQAERVYTLIDGYSPGTQANYAQEIIAWSIAPDTDAQLVKPTDLPSDELSTAGGASTPGVVSTTAQLQAGPTWLYNPQGLALDVTGGQRYVVLAASTVATPFTGPTVIRQIATTDAGAINTGDLVGSWSSTSLDGLPNASVEAGSDKAESQFPPAGLSTNPDGSLTVLLAPAKSEPNASFDVVTLEADLTAPRILVSSVNSPRTPYGEEAVGNSFFASAVRPVWPVKDTLGGQQIAVAPSPLVVQLSSGRYASVYKNNATYWASTGGDSGGSITAINQGIRVLAPYGDGTLSKVDSPQSSILNTLGNGTPGAACAIDAVAASIAAGADESIWIITTGYSSAVGTYAKPSGTWPRFTAGRQIIKLEQGAGAPCPQPSGTFTLANTSDPSTVQPADSAAPLTVGVGTTVAFNASPIDTANGTVFAYQWDLDGDVTNGEDGYEKVSAIDTSSPLITPLLTTASHTYTSPGVYHARLRLYGDYGAYQKEATIVVQSTNPPAAAFSVKTAAPQVGQAVSFDASASAPAAGARIANYHWEWGDGTADDVQSPQATHAYAAAGSYTVTLTIRDNDNRISDATSQSIVVRDAPSDGGGPPGDEQLPPPGGVGQQPPADPDQQPPLRGGEQPAARLGVRASVSRGTLSIALTAPKGSSSRGTIRLTTTTTRGKGRKRKITRVTLGSTSFSLTAGQRKTLRVRLNAKGRALLNKARKLRVQVVVTPRGGKSQTLSITLKR